MQARRFLLFLALAAPIRAVAGEPSDAERIAATYRPFQVGLASLAPDGQHLAYALRQSDRLYVAIVDLDHPESRVRVRVDAGTWPTAGLPPEFMWGGPPAYLEVNFLRWASPSRLVYATNYNGVYAVNSDGRKGIELANPNLLADNSPLAQAAMEEADELGRKRMGAPPELANGIASSTSASAPYPRRPQIVGFPPDHPQEIVVVSQGPNTSLFNIDVTTAKRTEVYHGRADQLLVDRQGRPRIFAARLPHEPTERLSYSSGEGHSAGFADLDQYLGSAASAPFAISPEGYLGTRSIPRIRRSTWQVRTICFQNPCWYSTATNGNW